MWCGAPAKLHFISFPSWYTSGIWCGQAVAALQGLQSTKHQFSHPRTSEAIRKGEVRSQWFISWVLAIAVCTPGNAGVISDVWAACHTDHLSGGNYFWSITNHLLQSGKCLPKTSTLIKSDHLICPLLRKEHCPHTTAGNSPPEGTESTSKEAWEQSWEELRGGFSRSLIWPPFLGRKI